MSVLKILARAIQLFIYAAAIPCAIGAVLGGRNGAALCLSLVIVLLLLGYFISTRIFLRRFASTSATPTLLKSLELATVGLNQELPELVTVPAVSLSALALRDGTGHAVLVVSQGLLAGLSEDELRATFRRGVLKVYEKGTPLRCLAALVSMLLLRFAPQSWSDLILQGEEPHPVAQPCGTAPERPHLTALGAIAFWCVVPGISHFIRLSQGAPHPGEDSSWHC
ncbi:MAG TPA: hypothetical protein DCS07_00255, partial [Bdellovibrionales bacterium]|nr:hypothetical protein [Bdellovibrionales bacterium]